MASSPTVNASVSDIVNATFIVGYAMTNNTMRDRHGWNVNAINQPTDFKRLTRYKIDRDGRITRLILGDLVVARDWFLPPEIARLDRLTAIRLRGCARIPTEISHLKHLVSLQLRSCDVAAMSKCKLLALTKLEIRNCSNVDPIMIKKQTPNLEQFVFSVDSLQNESRGVDLLPMLEEKCCFRRNLKTMILSDSRLNKYHFEVILFDILPQFTSLETLDLECNRIHSLRNIAARIEGSGETPAMKSLRPIRIRILRSDKKKGNQAFLTFLDPAKTKDVLILLNRFKGIINLGYSSYDSNVDIALRINRVGRVIVKGSKEGDMSKLKLWPTILGTKHVRSKKTRSRQIGRAHV